MTSISPSDLDQARDRLKAQAPQPGYLTIEEAAQLARCNPKTLRRAVQVGRLRAFRPVKRMLFIEEDVRAWVESKTAAQVSEPKRRSSPRGSRRVAPGSVASLKAIEAELTR